MTDKIRELEERIAHLTRLAEDLSDVVAEQAGRIERIEAQLAMVMRREAEREAGDGGGIMLGDQRPPHW